jgi:hypothetical protein
VAVPTTLVVGGSASGREAAIAAAALHAASRDAAPGDAPTAPAFAAAAAPAPIPPGVAILEGLSDGHSPLADLAEQDNLSSLQLIRIAPGCLCCAGNMILRVTLNRLLRRPPARLFISLADATHVETLRAWLSSAPYDTLLRLDADIRVS